MSLQLKLSESHKSAQVIIVFIILIFVTIVLFINLNPQEILKQVRDTKRLDDLSKIRSALDHYKADHGWTYPNSLSSLTDYISPIPTDPQNGKNYGYVINNLNTLYELNCILESVKKIPLGKYDGGDNENLYEIGTDLTLMQEGLYNDFGFNPPPKQFAVIFPKEKDVVSIKETKKGCFLNTKLSWQEVIDPGDTISYFYYLDNNPDFSSPEISGKTTNTTIDLTEYFKNVSCEKSGSEIYLIVVTQDSGGNLTDANPITIKTILSP